MTFDYLVKMTTVGEQSVGKTCLVNRFVSSKFTDVYDLTIGVDFSTKTIPVTYKGIKKMVKIQVWDTAGQEAFRSITRSYYKNSAVVLLVFDVSSRDSFIRTNKWLREVIDMNTANNPCVYLVGNKTDVRHREVERSVAEQYAMENSLIYRETSAKTGFGIEELFNEMALNVVKDLHTGIIKAGLGSGVKYREIFDDVSLRDDERINRCC